MSTDDGGGELTTGEAAEHLRRLRDTLGPDQLREAFETGGGLMDHEENRLRAAIDVLGTRRTAEILGVEVPDEGLPGEQVTIGGEPVTGRVPEERAEPVPDDTASLREFDHSNGGDAETTVGRGTKNCRSHQAALERLLASARRQGTFDFNEWDQAVAAAEQANCLTPADAIRLRDVGQSAAPEPSARQFNDLFIIVSRAFRGAPGNG